MFSECKEEGQADERVQGWWNKDILYYSDKIKMVVIIFIPH